jgi:hypothetical protein
MVIMDDSELLVRPKWDVAVALEDLCLVLNAFLDEHLSTSRNPDWSWKIILFVFPG